MPRQLRIDYPGVKGSVKGSVLGIWYFTCVFTLHHRRRGVGSHFLHLLSLLLPMRRQAAPPAAPEKCQGCVSCHSPRPGSANMVALPMQFCFNPSRHSWSGRRHYRKRAECRLLRIPHSALRIQGRGQAIVWFVFGFTN